MDVLIVLGVAALVGLVYAADRIIRWRRSLRQRRQMAYRLTAAAARAAVAERKRKAAVAASAELTSVIPAINHPRPTLGGIAGQAHRPHAAHGHGHTGPQRTGTGPQRQHSGQPAAARASANLPRKNGSRAQ